MKFEADSYCRTDVFFQSRPLSVSCLRLPRGARVAQLSNHIEFSREDTDEQKIEGMKGVVGEGETVWVKVVEVRCVVANVVFPATTIQSALN